MSDRPVVRCLECGLNQFARIRCGRCKCFLCAPLDSKPVALPTLFEAFSSLPTAEDLEGELIEEAIRRCDGDKTLAAKLIGIGKTTIYRKTKAEAAA